MPGVVTNSMSSPSSLKNPRSRATSTGRSCTAFMIATWVLLPAAFRVASCTAMAFSFVGFSLLLQLDFRFFHNLGPGFKLVLHERGEVFGRTARRHLSGFRHL